MMSFRNLLPKAAYAALLAVTVNLSAHGAPLNLQDVPLFLSASVDPNVLINMSVETPMGGAAYTDQVGIPAGCTGRKSISGNNDLGTCYFPGVVYKGYFDPDKCYVYSSGSSRFDPSSATLANHTCSGKWSGNFLNWASMTAIDMFIQTMTGGNRINDSTSLTVIRRARKYDSDSWFPMKVIGSGVTGSVASTTVTPYNATRLYIYNTTWGFNIGSTYSDTRNGSGGGFVGAFSAAMRVCQSATGIALEGNCVAYGSYYKPEGLIQKNSRSKRFGVLSYTFDNSNTRNGGVLRSKMKYVGPTLPDGSSNSAKEYGTNGLLISNPDGAGSGLNSGVINYINKFSDVGYKSYDPISELFYEGIRYFKNLGPTPEYSSGLSSAQFGGFQIVNAWDDPIQYRCQKNFTVAINDANPWLDKKLPGTAFTTNKITGAGGVEYSLNANDYGEPSNPDPDINVTELTNKVGDLEGLNGTFWPDSGTWQAVNLDTGAVTISGVNDSVGGGAGTFDNSCSAKTPGKLGEVMGTCPYTPKQNSYYIAGLAYYANTSDLRTDLPNDRGIQNVQSFIIDTQEYNANPLDGPKNMLWLAGKYGGFVDKGGDDFSPGDGVPQRDEWDADHDGVPDNYVLATDPTNLINGLNRAFQFIDQRTSSASSASVNSGSISSETRVYQARFNSGGWTGELISYPVNADGTLDSEEWNAATRLDSPMAPARKIITLNADGTKVPFLWTNLDATRKLQIDPTYVSDGSLGTARVNYLRGDKTNEGTSGFKFRSRSSKLGDIVSSSPIFVGAPRFSYRNNLESKPYSTFQQLYTDGNGPGRKQVVYAGANDGMLHAFDAENGNELLAYVPGAIYSNLRTLSDTNYSHKFFVDGAPNMGDVFINDNWETVLVGGLNQGGQGIYALKVTNPSTFSEASASNIILWEFTDANDADLGYTYSQPAIVRLHNGKWGAIFGNGYNNTANVGAQNSTTGNAVLYIVDIETGATIAKINTNTGMTQDPTGQNRPNGLSTPAVVDINGDAIADYVFAGDLFGNMWKFDISSNTSTDWDVAYTSGGVKYPLFSATDQVDADDASFLPQPITSRPEIIRGPNGVGMMVLFGTGKYLETADKTVDAGSPEVQTYYGLRDRNTGAATDRMTRMDLLKQSILAEVTVDSRDYRVTSKQPLNNYKGWRMDLVSPVEGYQGERQVSNSRVRNGRVIFTTLIPDQDPCNFGGDSWLMELDALSGSRLDATPIDRNGDGVFDSNDFISVNIDGETVSVPVSGLQPDVGITPDPGVLLNAEADKEFKYNPGTTGKIKVTVENPGEGASGRQSWRQIR